MKNHFMKNRTVLNRTYAAFLAPLAALALGGLTHAAGGAEPYTRVVEAGEDRIVHLEMCTRTLAPVSGDGPRVHLVSAIHIADTEYYAAMQEQLKSYDAVLYEGVKPAGLDPIDPELGDEAKADATRDRLVLLLEIADRHHARTGELPTGFDDLEESGDPRIAAMAASLNEDGWGNPILWMHTEVTLLGDETQTITFISRGADGRLEGEGVDADIELESKEYTPDMERDQSPDGIQAQLARALRVSFQLDEMDTTNPEWINADMDINQLQSELAAHGEESAAILEMLEGDSFTARIMGFALGFISRSPQLSSMMKLVLMDMLALAESADLLAQHDAISKVIVDSRNDVVIDYLKAEIEANPDRGDIGIFYGAGHMPGLEEAIIGMGYRVESDAWSTAMTVDISETGLTEGQVQMMRGMIRSSIEQQAGQ